MTDPIVPWVASPTTSEIQESRGNWSPQSEASLASVTHPHPQHQHQYHSSSTGVRGSALTSVASWTSYQQRQQQQQQQFINSRGGGGGRGSSGAMSTFSSMGSARWVAAASAGGGGHSPGSVSAGLLHLAAAAAAQQQCPGVTAAVIAASPSLVPLLSGGGGGGGGGGFVRATSESCERSANPHRQPSPSALSTSTSHQYQQLPSLDHILSELLPSSEYEKLIMTQNNNDATTPTADTNDMPEKIKASSEMIVRSFMAENFSDSLAAYSNPSDSLTTEQCAALVGKVLSTIYNNDRTPPASSSSFPYENSRGVFTLDRNHVSDLHQIYRRGASMRSQGGGGTTQHSAGPSACPSGSASPGSDSVFAVAPFDTHVTSNSNSGNNASNDNLIHRARQNTLRYERPSSCSVDDGNDIEPPLDLHDTASEMRRLIGGGGGGTQTTAKTGAGRGAGAGSSVAFVENNASVATTSLADWGTSPLPYSLIPATSFRKKKHSFRHTRSASVVETNSIECIRQINQHSIIMQLGQGCQGAVYLAVDTTINECRAIKEVVKQTVNTASLRSRVEYRRQRRRLMQEISVMKRCRHPNLVTLYEVIDDPEATSVYLVMKFIEHGPLIRLDSNGKASKAFNVRRVVRFAAQLCSALEYLHERRIVHCDIKPENILLGQDDVVYLADFGISRLFPVVSEQQHQSQLGKDQRQLPPNASFSSPSPPPGPPPPLVMASVGNSPLAMTLGDTVGSISAASMRGIMTDGTLGGGTVLFRAPELLGGTSSLSPVGSSSAVSPTTHTIDPSRNNSSSSLAAFANAASHHHNSQQQQQSQPPPSQSPQSSQAQVPPQKQLSGSVSSTNRHSSSGSSSPRLLSDRSTAAYASGSSVASSSSTLSVEHLEKMKRADVWALGISIFVLLYGRMPFAMEDKTTSEIFDAICSRDAIELPERCAGEAEDQAEGGGGEEVPLRVRKALSKMLEKNAPLRVSAHEANELWRGVHEALQGEDDAAELLADEGRFVYSDNDDGGGGDGDDDDDDGDDGVAAVVKKNNALISEQEASAVVHLHLSSGSFSGHNDDDSQQQQQQEQQSKTRSASDAVVVTNGSPMHQPGSGNNTSGASPTTGGYFSNIPLLGSSNSVVSSCLVTPTSGRSSKPGPSFSDSDVKGFVQALLPAESTTATNQETKSTPAISGGAKSSSFSSSGNPSTTRHPLSAEDDDNDRGGGGGESIIGSGSDRRGPAESEPNRSHHRIRLLGNEEIYEGEDEAAFSNSSSNNQSSTAATVEGGSAESSPNPSPASSFKGPSPPRVPSNSSGRPNPRSERRPTVAFTE